MDAMDKCRSQMGFGKQPINDVYWTSGGYSLESSSIVESVTCVALVNCPNRIVVWRVQTYYHVVHISLRQHAATIAQPFTVHDTMKTNTLSPNAKLNKKEKEHRRKKNYIGFQNQNVLKQTDNWHPTKHRIDQADQDNVDLLDVGNVLHLNEEVSSSTEPQMETVGVAELEMGCNYRLDESRGQPLSISKVNCVHENDNGHNCERKGNNKSHDDCLTEQDQSSSQKTNSFVQELCDFPSKHLPTCINVEGYLEINSTDCNINNVNDVLVSQNTEQKLIEGIENKNVDCDSRSGSNNGTNVLIQHTEETVNMDGLSRPSLPNTENTNDSSDINIRTMKHPNANPLEDYMPLDSNDSGVLNNDYVQRPLYPNNDDFDSADHASKQKQSTTNLTCNVVNIPKQIPDQLAFLKDFLKKLSDTSDTCRVVGPRNFLVLPATQDVIEELRRIVDKTVKGEPVPAQQSMQYELLRSCTYRTFPKDGKPDVRKMAEAGFYYASNNDEVICYCCYKRISNWKADDDPMMVHLRISPACRFHIDKAVVNVTKEVTAHVESEIMAKIQSGGRQRNTAPQSATIPTRQSSSEIRNIADAAATSANIPTRPHGQFVFGQSDDISLPAYQPPDRPHETSKYQSMMPQNSRSEAAYPARTPFQTGVFVPQDKFRHPNINTKAVQPSDDTHEQGVDIYEYVRESHSRSEEVQTSAAPASTPAETSTQPQPRRLDSLIRSDASVIVQDMGYTLAVVRQALSNLLDKGQAQPDAQEIMNEIFQIEDGTT